MAAACAGSGSTAVTSSRTVSGGLVAVTTVASCFAVVSSLRSAMTGPSTWGLDTSWAYVATLAWADRDDW